MGRIDDALRRSKVDVGGGAGAPAPAPWRFEPREGRPPSLETRNRELETGNRQLETPSETGNGKLATANGQAVPWAGLEPSESARLVLSKDAPPLLVEQFRSLAATLLGSQREQPLKSVIVTSASPGDGKSLVAVNLALTLSESYRRRVLLVDADLRRPSLHQVFGAPHAHGLSDALRANADEEAPVVKVTDSLTLLPAGRPERDPLAGLSSARMHRIIEDAVARFDWVIVDSPPVGVLADGRLVCEMVNGALLVVRAGVTRFPDLEAAADTIGRERILGLVLNAVDPVEIRGEDYYRHYYYGNDAGGADRAR